MTTPLPPAPSPVALIIASMPPVPAPIDSNYNSSSTTPVSLPPSAMTAPDDTLQPPEPEPLYYRDDDYEPRVDGVYNATTVETTTETYTSINVGPIIFSFLWLIAIIILTAIIILVIRRRRRRRHRGQYHRHGGGGQHKSKSKDKNGDDAAGAVSRSTPPPTTSAPTAVVGGEGDGGVTPMTTATILPTNDNNSGNEDYPETATEEEDNDDYGVSDDDDAEVDGIIVEAVDVETAVFGNNNGEDKRGEPSLSSTFEFAQATRVNSNGRSPGGSCCCYYPYGTSISILSIFTSFIGLILSIVVHTTCKFVDVINPDTVQSLGIWSLQYSYSYTVEDFNAYANGQCNSYGINVDGSSSSTSITNNISAVLRIARGTSILSTVVGGVMFLMYMALFGCNSDNIIKNGIMFMLRGEYNVETKLRRLKNILSRPIWIVAILQLSTLVLFFNEECQSYDGCGIEIGSISAITATMYWLLCGLAVSSLPFNNV